MPNSPVVKRPRAGSMRRTTSMKALPPSPEHNSSAEIQKHRFCLEDNGSISGGLKCPVIILPSATFLHSCYLCKRRLNPTRDIYMYRGDAAFCSLECRQEQIVMDERKEKCMLEGRKMDNVVMVSTHNHNHNQPSAASQSHAHKVQATA